jgi:hypothetical protein
VQHGASGGSQAGGPLDSLDDCFGSPQPLHSMGQRFPNFHTRPSSYGRLQLSLRKPSDQRFDSILQLLLVLSFEWLHHLQGLPHARGCLPVGQRGSEGDHLSQLSVTCHLLYGQSKPWMLPQSRFEGSSCSLPPAAAWQVSSLWRCRGASRPPASTSPPG